jgi:hypothetical protein
MSATNGVTEFMDVMKPERSLFSSDRIIIVAIRGFAGFCG